MNDISTLVQLKSIAEMTGVQGLVRHLKETPVPGTAESLAQQFGVDVAIAELALRNVASHLKRKKGEDQPSILDRTFAWVAKFWDRITNKLLLFIIVSSVITSCLLVLIDTLPKSAKIALPLAGPLMLVIAFLVIPVLHALAVFYRGSSKEAVIGALVWPLFTIVPIAITNKDGEFPAGLALALYVAMLMIYSFVVIPTSVIGSYVRMKKHAKSLDGLSRQQMIERLIEIRTLIGQQPESMSARIGVAKKVGFVEKNLEGITFTLALVFSASASHYLALSDPNHILLDMEKSQQIAAKEMPPFMVVAGLISLASNGLAFCAGLASKTVKKVALVYLFICLGHFSSYLIPNGYFTMGMISEMGVAKVFSGYLMYALFQGVGFMARKVYEYSQKSKRREKNDPDVLLEEMLELEWRLMPSSSKIAVLAVDVVGSTAMKKDSDPMITEWSFRAYQDWVARICAHYGGKVESKAGDGTILGFENCDDAVKAAQELQNRIAEFNSTENKMPLAFAIRAGIHYGDVQGSLGDVQFTRVIDVAAHVEGAAPVGGIAISDSVAEKIEIAGFVKSNKNKDGHEIHVWTNGPT